MVVLVLACAGRALDSRWPVPSRLLTCKPFHRKKKKKKTVSLSPARSTARHPLVPRLLACCARAPTVSTHPQNATAAVGPLEAALTSVQERVGAALAARQDGLDAAATALANRSGPGRAGEEVLAAVNVSVGDWRVLVVKQPHRTLTWQLTPLQPPALSNRKAKILWPRRI